MSSFEQSISASPDSEGDREPSYIEQHRVLALGGIALHRLLELKEQGDPTLVQAINDELMFVRNPASQANAIQDQRE